ncbi:MAG: hypothetical protein EHM42_13420 [Planctomycetaceae bacterium]|nr:MAG: hypothetical protein EHM42_13420 [Planctomycetaceae bacterium]
MSRNLKQVLLTLWIVALSIPAAAQELGSLAALDLRIERCPAGQIIAIDLGDQWLTDADLKQLASFPALERIRLARTKITDLGLEHLAPLEGVKTLDLEYAEYVTDRGIAHLKHWRNLEHLNLRGTKVTSTVFEHVSSMKKLKFLDVGYSRVNDDFFENLGELEQLEHFAFGGNKLSGAALPLLKLLPALKELDVSGNQRTDSGLWGVAMNDFNVDQIAQLSQLEVLDLGETGVSDRGVARLAQLPHLRRLDLRGTRVTRQGLSALTSLANLTRLSLWRAEGVDDGAIPALLEMRSLEILEISETKISAAGVGQLTQMRGLRQLFVGGLELSAEQLEILRRELPECRVSWWEKPNIAQPPRRGRRGANR